MKKLWIWFALFTHFISLFASVSVVAFPLAKSGILKNRKAITYHLWGGYKREKLKNFGLILGDEWLVIL